MTPTDESPAVSRDYNAEHQDAEGSSYSYAFDDIMRGYLWRTLSPMLRHGPTLEMGCYLGEFTSILARELGTFDVVEGSDELIASTSARVGPDVRFFHSTFETFEPDTAYANVFLMHTLEHLDDPVDVLARVRDWMAPEGRLFVVVPNADAPSRQIAVRMGLIPHSRAVTEAEWDHGHRRTYAAETLEADVVAGGWRVVDRGGVMFKPLANFQIDKALDAEIISPEFLEACYDLGDLYPQLCASVYVVAEAGEPG